MVILTILGIIYLILGVVYAIYILILGKSSILAFPINALGGPLVVIYIVYKTLRRERINY